MPTKISFTWDEMVAYSETQEAKANLAETVIRLQAMPGHRTEDPENPWLTETDFARAMTRAQREEYLAIRQNAIVAG
ncbi:MAG: hypothetical protein FWG12_07735 [Holophagaceae bacterium]|jgi:hypothetical protein|nr:hypothetical protein [Holophagaceae bacterium]